MMKKTMFSLLIGFLLLSGLCSCTAGTDTGTTDSPVSISLDSAVINGLTLLVGEQVTVGASASNSSALVWSSSDSSVVLAIQGILEGKSAGTATVTVSSGDAEAHFSVTVKKKVPVSAVAFTTESIETLPDASLSLSISVSPADATDKTVTYRISPVIAGVRVTKNGLLVTENVPDGTEFTVTAQAGDKIDTLHVLVKARLSDFTVTGNDFKTEITALTVPLDEPFRVLFCQPQSADTVFSSSDTGVCTVSQKGRLTFHAIGNAVISIERNGISKQIPITVTEKSGDFIENYFLPQSYINYLSSLIASEANGWHEVADFKSGGTGAKDAKSFVFEKYAAGTGPGSWISGGGNCIELGAWDNIGTGLEDDDLPGGGMANLYLWAKMTFGENAQKLRVQFDYRASDATFHYKLRLTVIDLVTKKVTHLTDWQRGSKIGGDIVYGNAAIIEANLPESCCANTVIVMLEYDDIDYPTDGIVNGVDSVNIKSFDVFNDDGSMGQNSLLVIGDSIMTTEFSSYMTDDIATRVGYILVRDTISGSTIAPASSIGIVDHIDCGYYQSLFTEGKSPSMIVIQRGSNDLYWSGQAGNPLKLGDVTSTDKKTTFGAIRYLLDFFTETYPDAKIVWSTVMYRSDVDDSRVRAFNAALQTVLSGYENVTLFDLYTECAITSANYKAYLADGIHPNSAGVNVLREAWIDCLYPLCATAAWAIGSSNFTTEFTGTMVDEIVQAFSLTLFRDTISGSTIAPASSIGIVDHIDAGLYETTFKPFGMPRVIMIDRSGNDIYFSHQAGNPLRLGEVNSRNKTETYGAVRYVIEYFTEHYPDALIVWSNKAYGANGTVKAFTEFNTAFSSICADYDNVTIIDLYTKTGFTPDNIATYTIADHIHFNALGQSIVRDIWIEAMRPLLEKSDN